MLVNISKVAKTQLKKIISNNGKAAYLYVSSGGCNGFKHKIKILKEDKKPNPLDEVIRFDDYNLYLCNKSLLYLIGTNIDYKTDIMGSRFDFSNDKISSKCGCGTSVNFDMDKLNL